MSSIKGLNTINLWKNKISKLFKNKYFLFALFFFLIVLAVGTVFAIQNTQKQTARAAFCTWAGTNSGDFSDAGNWSACPTTSGVPENGDDITFPDVASNYTLNNDISGLSLNTVTVEALNSSAYTLSGNTLDVAYGITTTSGTNSFIYNTNVTTCRTEGDGNITINSGITYTSGCDGLNYDFSGNIYGSGTFVKTGGWYLNFKTTQTIDTAFVVNSGLVGTDYGSQVTFNSSLDLNGGSIYALGSINVPNNTIQVNAGSGIYQYSGLITAYGISFNGGSNSTYYTWAGNSNNTTITGSDVNLNGVTFDSNYFNYVGKEQITIQTTNGHVITGQFSNLPSGGSAFINYNGSIVEIAATYNSDSVVVKALSIFNGTDILSTDLTNIACTPTSGYGSVTPTCSASFASGKHGNVTFTTSAGSCTTPAIVLTDTQASCSFTISTPSSNPYSVDVSASGGGTISNVDNIFVYQTSTISLAEISNISCTPKTGYGSVTPTCSASFTTGKEGTITFTTSAGSCTTPTIVPTDTQASCNFTISTPSFTPYQVDVSASGGGNLNGVDYVYVYQTPTITAVNPSTGPVAGGASVTVDLSSLSGKDRNYKVVRDSSDNIYVVGQVSGTVKVGSSYVNGYGGTDIFIAKYDSSGNIIWAKTAGGSGDDTAFSVVIDSNSDIYVTGNFQGYANIVGNSVVSTGGTDVFIAKLDSNGNTIWVRTGGGTQDDSAQGMDIDSSGNIYIVGYFSSVSAFGGTNLTSAGITDIFILKLDSNGNWVWAKRGGGSSYEYVGGIAVNPKDGSVYVSGHYNNTTTFGSTTLYLDAGRAGYDVFLAKTDANGDWVWAKDIGNTGGVDLFNGDQAFSNKVYADSNGNAYILGGFYKDYIDFGSAGQVTNVSTNGLDPFNGAPAQHYIAKADIDGNWLWAKPLGETTYYFSGAFKIKDTSTAYVSTLIIGSNTFDFGGVTIDKTTTGGNANAIVAKVNLVDGSFSDVVQTTGTSGSEVIRDIEIDSSNNLVLVGNTSGTSNFGSNSYSSIGDQDSEISKLDTTSNTFTSLQGLGSTIPFFVDLNPSANSILFDGTAGNITSVNTPLQAVVNTPAHTAGLVDVIARNSLSVSASLGGAYTYIGSGSSCQSGSSGTNSSGNTAITNILLCLGGGNLVLTSPSSTNFGSVTVSTSEQNTSATLNNITVEDLRASEAGWSLVCKSTNLTGTTDNSWIIPVYKDSASKFNITPSVLSVVGAYGNIQSGLTDYTNLQNTTEVTNANSNGESNNFNLASFTSGHGVGKYSKDLSLGLVIPPYIRAQAYTGTLICSVS